MSRDLCYCTNELCPIKENCKRSTSLLSEEELNQDLWIFTDSPGALRMVSSKEIWICPKQLVKDD